LRWFHAAPSSKLRQRDQLALAVATRIGPDHERQPAS
jgi:hypothetical protein